MPATPTSGCRVPATRQAAEPPPSQKTSFGASGRQRERARGFEAPEDSLEVLRGGWAREGAGPGAERRNSNLIERRVADVDGVRDEKFESSPVSWRDAPEGRTRGDPREVMARKGRKACASTRPAQMGREVGWWEMGASDEGTEEGSSQRFSGSVVLLPDRGTRAWASSHLSA